MFHVEVFSKGKKPSRNEDYVGYDSGTVVLSDGCTDKAGIRYEENSATGEFKTGGEVASRLVVGKALASHSNGQELVAEVASAIRDYYKQHSPEALTDSAYRFAATMVVARISGDELVVTQVGDSYFRINGRNVYRDEKEIDAKMTAMRLQHIEKTGDVEAGRALIMPYLKEQHKLHNNDQDEFGYGIMDGGDVPAKFTRTCTFPLSEVQTVELVSDGYFGAFPTTPSVEEYEKLYQRIKQIDPHKIKEYPSTKSDDDRTVVVATLGPDS